MEGAGARPPAGAGVVLPLSAACSDPSGIRQHCDPLSVILALWAVTGERPRD